MEEKEDEEEEKETNIVKGRRGEREWKIIEWKGKSENESEY